MRTNLYDLNNGSIILKIGKFMHAYDCMIQLALDIKTYWEDKNTRGWDGNEYDELKDTTYSKDNEVTVYDLKDPFLIIKLAEAHGRAEIDLAKNLLGAFAVENLSN